MRNKELKIKLLIMILLSSLLWFAPHPTDITLQTWHLFTIFIATIAGIIFLPAPMGVVAIISITLAISTKTLTVSQGLSGFSSSVVWLVVLVFFIARVFIKSGLGTRIAYFFIIKFGHSTIGLSYSLILTEFLIAPFIPSIAARGGGVIFPIVQSLSQIYSNAEAKDPEITKKNKTGAFLMQICFQCNAITGGLFLTSMASNPLAASFAASLGVHISWLSWAKGTVLIGIINLLLLPIVVFFLVPPAITKSKQIPKLAATELKKMGKLKSDEIILSITFALLMLLWIFGDMIGIEATAVSLIGISILLIFGSLTWSDLISEKNAWETFIWFGILVTLSQSLNTFGMMNWVNEEVQLIIGQHTGIFVISCTLILYFYTHYFFASSSVHITVMYSSFLIILLKLNVPPLAAALSLAILSNLSGGLTHYSTSTAPIYFEPGYLSTLKWWRAGGIVSIFNLLLWGILTPLWWKLLGWW